MHRLLLYAALLSVGSACAAGENYALLVAVGDYDEKELRPLRYTRSDIIDFHEALVESGFPSKNIVLMHDDLKRLVLHYDKLGPDYKSKDYLPFAAAIRKELELLLGRLRPDDSVVVAFAGHGVQFRGEKKTYFCPLDAKLAQKDSMIAFEEVLSALKASAAGRKLFLVDACQNDPQSEIARSRSTVNLESITRPQTEPIPEGIIALFSCKSGQKAFEHPPLGHGVFFYHVLDGWKGKADENRDGDLTYQELALFAERETARYASLNLKVLQTPQLTTEFSGQWVLRKVRIDRPRLLTAPFDAAAARTGQTAWAEYLRAGAVEKTLLGTEMRLIAPGEFMMGAPGQGNGEGMFGEQPQHRVRITRPFYLGEKEITQSEFRDVMQTNPSGFASTGTHAKYVKDVNTDSFPVERATWFDAIDYCNRLSERAKLPAYYGLANVQRKGGVLESAEVTVLGGRGYRLPTEAEWEYACRAGTTTPYWFGTEWKPEFAHIGPSPASMIPPGRVLPRPVGQLNGNAFGLRDTLGNVREWCFDWYSSKYYASSPVDNPPGPATPEVETKDVPHRMTRGGDYANGSDYGHVWDRFGLPPGYRGPTVGFRIARDAEETK